MSQIQIRHGSAEVTLDAVSEVQTARSGATSAAYSDRDLIDATCAALLAVNTPRSRAWADVLFRLTGGAQ